MKNVICIVNNGPSIKQTNYFDLPQAEAGMVYLSWNAGVGRLLVPDIVASYLDEMQSAREVIVTRGLWRKYQREALELMWEDDSDAPFSIIIVSEQCDRLLPETDQGGGFSIVAWTRTGKGQHWPGRYRKEATVPYLKPWKQH